MVKWPLLVVGIGIALYDSFKTWRAIFRREPRWYRFLGSVVSWSGLSVFVLSW